MTSALVYLVLTVLSALLTGGMVVATMVEGHPLAGTLLVFVRGGFLTASAAINAHYAE
jgi:hypothetical protein